MLDWNVRSPDPRVRRPVAIELGICSVHRVNGEYRPSYPADRSDGRLGQSSRYGSEVLAVVPLRILSVGRHAGLLPEMPLADLPSHVTGIGKRLLGRWQVPIQPRTVAPKVRDDSVLVREQPGHQRRPRRTAEGRRTQSVLESDPFARQPVNIGGLDDVVPGASKGSVVELIGDDDKDVRSPLGTGGNRRQAAGKS